MSSEKSIHRLFVLLAGGSGSRFGGNIPKQMSMLAGKSILEHSIQNISSYIALDAIVVVAKKEIFDDVNAIIDKMSDNRIVMVEGGASRIESTYNGVTTLSVEPDCDVLIHDAVRPFLPHSVIDDCWRKLEKHDSVDVVVPSVDTVVHLSSNKKTINNIPEREYYFRGQTPQGFKLKQLCQAYEDIPDLSNAKFTDDCGLFKKVFPEKEIGIVYGSEENIKITFPRDLVLAEQIIKSGIGVEERVRSTVRKSVQDLNVVVFGGSSGFGLDIADQLRLMGAKVFSATRSSGVDIRDSKAIQNFLSNIEEREGSVDLVINSAGVLDIGRLPDQADDVIVDSIMINYVGSVNVAKQSYDFLKRSQGQLILFASSSYFRGRQNYSVYSSSKAAIVNFTQALAEEWVEDGIRVNCIVPRRADTPMRRKAFPGEDPTTLLSPKKVTEEVLGLLGKEHSGLIVHVY